MHNRDISGALASLSSVAKLPYESCLDGISNTFCIVPSALGKEDSRRKNNLVTLLDGYFGLNAHHINVNVLNKELLQDAHIHPEKYPNLTIRVSGYAVRFNQLSPEQREEVLKRTMHGTSVSTFSKVSKVGPEMCDVSIEQPVNIDFDLNNIREEIQNSGKLTKGAVHSIETYTTTDGDGIRCLVFLQGCSKRCIFCSNPEMQCIVNPDTCPGVAMTDKEVCNVVGRYERFLKPNGGGITISGGEPLLQPDFVAAVFNRVHKLGLTTCLDTSGHGDIHFWDKVLPSTDHVMLCVKAMDLDLAAFITGVSRSVGGRAKEFAYFIRDNYKNTKLSLRWVLLEDLNDTNKEIDALAKFAKSLSPVFTHVEILPYHNLAKEKYEHLGREYPMGDAREYPQDKALEVKHRLENLGVKCTLASNGPNLE